MCDKIIVRHTAVLKIPCVTTAPNLPPLYSGGPAEKGGKNKFPPFVSSPPQPIVGGQPENKGGDSTFRRSNSSENNLFVNAFLSAVGTTSGKVGMFDKTPPSSVGKGPTAIGGKSSVLNTTQVLSPVFPATVNDTTQQVVSPYASTDPWTVWKRTVCDSKTAVGKGTGTANGGKNLLPSTTPTSPHSPSYPTLLTTPTVNTSGSPYAADPWAPATASPGWPPASDPWAAASVPPGWPPPAAYGSKDTGKDHGYSPPGTTPGGYNSWPSSMPPHAVYDKGPQHATYDKSGYGGKNPYAAPGGVLPPPATGSPYDKSASAAQKGLLPPPGSSAAKGYSDKGGPHGLSSSKGVSPERSGASKQSEYSQHSQYTHVSHPDKTIDEWKRGQRTLTLEQIALEHIGPFCLDQMGRRIGGWL